MDTIAPDLRRVRAEFAPDSRRIRAGFQPAGFTYKKIDALTVLGARIL
jgi:hypothetical protein